jgi:phage replication O-like protein O
MANPQRENGFTPISNEIMDALVKTRIPGQARQVLDFILRKTYGYNKPDDSISLTQFKNATGLSRSHVCRSVLLLIKMNLIVPIKGLSSPNKGTIPATKYSFQKDYDLWVVSPNKGTSPNIGNLGSPNIGTYKRNIVFKETIPPSSDGLNLSQLLSGLILKNNPSNRELSNEKIKNTIPKWALEIDKILRIDKRPAAEIRMVIEWSQADSFWRTNILSASSLRKQYDKLKLRAVPVISEPKKPRLVL